MKEEKKTGTEDTVPGGADCGERAQDAARHATAPRTAEPESDEARASAEREPDRTGTTRTAGQGPLLAGDPDAKFPVSGRRRFPTVADLLVFLGFFLVANLVGSAVALLVGCPWPDTAGALSDDEAVREVAQLGLAQYNAVSYFVSMALTLGAFLFYRARRGGPRTVGSFSARGLNPVVLLWGVLLVFSTTVVLEPLLVLLPEVPNVYGRGVWAVVMVVVMAPLFEEVIFRGVLLESLRARYGVVAAWLVSSLLFGVVHVHPTVAVNAFFMGLILGFIYLATKSLWSTIFLHAVNNGIAFVALAAGLGTATLTELVDNRTLYVVIYIVAVAVVVISACMMLRTLRRMRSDEKNRAGA